MTHPATRAARRAAARKHPQRRQRTTHSAFSTKDWKLLILRRNKLKRARQLGRLWPHPGRQLELILTETDPLHVLFICSRNQWRSPTAEAIYRKAPGLAVRSAGTARAARRQVKLTDIRWADLILVMEDKHASRLRAEFRQDLRHKALHVLDIPDDYGFMDPELVDLLGSVVDPLIDAAQRR